MDFENVGVYGSNDFNAWEWKCVNPTAERKKREGSANGETQVMTILKESLLFPLPVGANVNLLGVTMFW